MPPSVASSSLRQAALAFTSEAAGREGRRGEERGDDDAKAKRDSPARNLKRSISGSGDDAA